MFQLNNKPIAKECEPKKKMTKTQKIRFNRRNRWFPELDDVEDPIPSWSNHPKIQLHQCYACGVRVDNWSTHQLTHLHKFNLISFLVSPLSKKCHTCDYTPLNSVAARLHYKSALHNLRCTAISTNTTSPSAEYACQYCEETLPTLYNHDCPRLAKVLSNFDKHHICLDIHLYVSSTRCFYYAFSHLIDVTYYTLESVWLNPCNPDKWEAARDVYHDIRSFTLPRDEPDVVADDCVDQPASYEEVLDRRDRSGAVEILPAFSVDVRNDAPVRTDQLDHFVNDNDLPLLPVYRSINDCDVDKATLSLIPSHVTPPDSPQLPGYYYDFEAVPDVTPQMPPYEPDYVYDYPSIDDPEFTQFDLFPDPHIDTDDQSAQIQTPSSFSDPPPSYESPPSYYSLVFPLEEEDEEVIECPETVPNSLPALDSETPTTDSVPTDDTSDGTVLQSSAEIVTSLAPGVPPVSVDTHTLSLTANLAKTIMYETNTWSTTDTPGRLLHRTIPGDLFALGSNTHVETLSLCQFARFDTKIILNVVGNRFYQGLLVGVLRPVVDNDLIIHQPSSEFTSRDILQMPGAQLIYANSSSSYVFEFPFFSETAQWSTTNAFDTAKAFDNRVGCILDLYVLSPLKTIDAQANHITYTILAEFPNATLNQRCERKDINFPTTDSLNPPPLLDVVPQVLNTDGLINSAQGMVNVVKNVTDKVPFLKTGIDLALGMFLDKPTIVTPPVRVQPVAGTQWQHAAGVNDVNRVSFAPGSITLPISNSIPRPFINNDVRELCRRPGLIAQMTITPNTAPNSVIFREIVTPFNPPIVDNVSSVTCATPLDYFSRSYSFWRGSIEYEVVVVGTEFHTLRLLGIHAPGKYDDKFTLSEVTNYEVVNFEYGPSNTSFCFSCAHINDTVWNPSGVYPNALNHPRPFTNPAWLGNGIFMLVVQNSLVAPSNVAQSVEIFVFKKSGNDYDLNGYTGLTESWGHTYDTPDEQAPPLHVDPQSAPPTYVENSNLDLSEAYFGERQTRLTDLTKKASYTGRVFLSSTGLTGDEDTFNVFKIDDTTTLAEVSNFPLVRFDSPIESSVNAARIWTAEEPRPTSRPDPSNRSHPVVIDVFNPRSDMTRLDEYVNKAEVPRTTNSTFTTLRHGFIGHRGSLILRFNFQPNTVGHISLNRLCNREVIGLEVVSTNGAVAKWILNLKPSSQTVYATFQGPFNDFTRNIHPAAGQGAIPVNSNIAPVVEIEIPHFYNLNFARSSLLPNAIYPTVVFTGTLNVSPSIRNSVYITDQKQFLEGSFVLPVCDVFVCGGDDYQNINWLCCPTIPAKLYHLVSTAVFPGQFSSDWSTDNTSVPDVVPQGNPAEDLPQAELNTEPQILEKPLLAACSTISSAVSSATSTARTVASGVADTVMHPVASTSKAVRYITTEAIDQAKIEVKASVSQFIDALPDSKNLALAIGMEVTNVVLHLHNILHASSPANFLKCILHFLVGTVFGRSCVSSLESCFTKLIDFVGSSQFLQTDQAVDVVPQDGSTEDPATKTFVSHIISVVQVLIQSVTKCVSFVFPTKFLTDAYSFIVKAGRFASALNSCKNFIKWTLELLGWIKDNVLYYLSGSGKSANREATWKVLDDIHAFNSIHSNVDEALSETDVQEILRIYDRVLAVSREMVIQKDAALNSLTRHTFEEFRKTHLKAAQIQRNQKSSRIDPFFIVLFGDPGCGKSSVAVNLCYDTAAVFGWSQDNLICPVNPQDDYGTGYNHQKIELYDDLHSSSDEETWKEILLKKSNLPYKPNLASLDDKGKAYSSELMVATTNSPYPTFNTASTPLALWRRRNLLVEVKKNVNGDRNFRFVDPLNSEAQTRVLTNWMNYEAFLAVYINTLRAHYATQNELLKTFTETSDAAKKIIALSERKEVFDDVNKNASRSINSVMKLVLEKAIPYAASRITRFTENCPEEFQFLKEFGLAYRPIDPVGPDVKPQNGPEEDKSDDEFDDAQDPDDDLLKQLDNLPSPPVDDYIPEHFRLKLSDVMIIGDFSKVWSASSLMASPKGFGIVILRSTDEIREYYGTEIQMLDALFSDPCDVTTGPGEYDEIEKQKYLFGRQKYKDLQNFTQAGEKYLSEQLLYYFLRRHDQQLVLALIRQKLAEESEHRKTKPSCFSLQPKPTPPRVLTALEQLKKAGDVFWQACRQALAVFSSIFLGIGSIVFMCWVLEKCDQRAPSTLPQSNTYHVADGRALPKGVTITVPQMTPAEVCLQSSSQLLNKTRSWELIGDLETVFEDKTACINRKIQFFQIYGRYAVCPKHYFDSVKAAPRAFFRITIEGGTGLISQYTRTPFLLRETDVIRSEKQDLAMFALPKWFNTAPNFVKHTPTNADLPYLTRVNSSVRVYNKPKLINGKLTEGERLDAPSPMYTEVRHVVDALPVRRYLQLGVEMHFGWQYKGIFHAGDCGSLLIANAATIQRRLLGMHVGSVTTASYGVSVLFTQELLQAMIDKLDQVHSNIVLEDLPPVTFEARPQGPQGIFTTLGTMPQHLVPGGTNKTQIKPSPIHGMAYEVTTRPPYTVEERKQAGLGDLFRNAVEKYSVPFTPFRANTMKVVEAHLNDVFDNDFPPTMPKRLLTWKESVVGIPEVDYVDSINLSASAGHPFTTPSVPKTKPGKRTWINEDGTIVPQLLAELELEDSLMRQGRRPIFVWTDLEKDQRLLNSKVAAGKVRAFTNGNLKVLLHTRRYFGAFSAAFYASHLETFSAVGIDIHGPEWSKLLNKLHSKGANAFDGDFGRWDGSMKLDCMLLFVKLVNRWYNDSKENQRVREVLMDDLIHTIQLFRNTLYQTHQGNPSGNALTVVVNTCVNYMYFCNAWVDLIHEPLSTFRNSCGLAFYGDDNHVVPGAEYEERFNLETCKAYFARFGLEYGGADKDGSSYTVRPIDDCAFLKNRSRQDNRYGTLFHPLMDKTTITELTNWIRTSPDDLEAHRLNLKDACEFFYHYSREEYDVFRANVLAAEQEALTGINATDLPTYDDLDQTWLAKHGIML
jgi:hypothetical protein